MHSPSLAAVALAAWLGISPVAAFAVHGAEEEIVVYGRATQQLGTAHAASEGLIGFDDIQLPPLLRVGELVEFVPGMVATQHSGTGKANQFFLRGFNLDHGTDFSAHLDGVPINMRTHGHGQGYLDLNFMIPELVQTLTYRKGNYSAQVGDFSSAGSVEFSYADRLEESLLEGTIGEDGYGRGLIASSAEVGPGVVTGAFDVTVYDGPWELEEDLEQYKLYLAYTVELGAVRARLTAQAYDGEWDSTDQIPRRAVEQGLIGERGFIDPDLGGDTERYALTAALDWQAWSLGGYFIDYDFTLFSNFTYLLDDPVNGDQFEQRDERKVWGLWLDGALDAEVGNVPVTWRWGGDLRYDDIDEVALYDTVSRTRNATTRNDRVEQLSLSAFGESELALTEQLRVIAGVRADYFDWDVNALRDPNSGTGDDALVSPKLSAAYRFSDRLEGYASWGRGFHSNDVRADTISIDPDSGDPVGSQDVLVDSEGAELGIRFELGERFNATLVGFYLELDSELVFVGDAGTTEANDGSERYGIETTAFWQANRWLALNATYTYTDAEFKEDQGGGKEIPGAVEETFVLGANAAWENGISASVRARYLGEAPMVEDNSVTADDSWLLSAGAGYRRGAVEVRVDVFNLLDSDDDDISYFYASRLEGEPAQGIEDVHFHPLEPRTVRATVRLFW